jgi:hypothetical protein
MVLTGGLVKGLVWVVISPMMSLDSRSEWVNGLVVKIRDIVGNCVHKTQM